MITIPNYKVSEASAVYGDYGAQKVAFTINVNPADVLGAIAGGYTSNTIYNKKKDQAEQAQQQSQKIENDSYAQIQNLMQNLKIVFTPINVIFSVNGQVFDIIQASEMNPYMKQAFLQKDGDYFRNLLMNKINMELQMAEKAFSQRLLTAGGYGEQAKEANYTDRQEALFKVAEEQFDSMVKTASSGLEGINLSINPSFDSLRPFDKSEVFFRPNEFKKVAGIFGVLGHHENPGQQDVGLHRFNSEINVGFLPDRVVFLWNGQLVDQLSLLHMNEQGYEAFRNRDKEFFINLFKKNTIDTDKELHKPIGIDPDDLNPEDAEKIRGNRPKGRNLAEPEEEKTAAIIEEVIEDDIPETSNTDIFQNPDIHPVVYDMVLTDRYGNWSRFETEALLKQIEIDFKLEHGIAENPFNKICSLQSILHPDSAVFFAPFSFEKFIRAMNSKSVYFEDFQGNLLLEEILFGLEIAKTYCGEEIFWQMNENVAAYVSEELMKSQIRHVNKNLYDASNPAEKSFFDDVNGYLMRKWKEYDAKGIFNDDEIDQHHILTEQIVEIANEVIDDYLDEIDMNDPYVSVTNIIVDNNLLESVDSEYKRAIRNMVKGQVVEQLLSALFLDYKNRELVHTEGDLKEEGVIRG